MELTLNLVWVGVAIVGILVQIVMLLRAGSVGWRRENPWRGILAMASALVILFFVISMTDDLHDQALLLEERKLGRVTLGMRASEDPSSERSLGYHSWQFFPVGPFSPPSLGAVSRLGSQFGLRLAPAVECDCLCGRAPPAFRA